MIESLGKIRVSVQSRIHKLQITSSNVWLFDGDSQILETNPSARTQTRTNELPITSSDCVYLMVTPSEILGKIRVPGKSFPPLQGDSCYRTIQIEMTCNISRWLRKPFGFNL